MIPNTGAAARALREFLSSVSYDEKSCCRAAGVSSVRDLADSVPLQIPEDLPRNWSPSPLEVAIQLFLLRQRVSARQLEVAAGKKIIDELLHGGVLLDDDTSLGAHIRAYGPVFPCFGLFVVTDWPGGPGVGVGSMDDAVPTLRYPAYDLATAMSQRFRRRSLDLCSGSGLHTLLASRQSDRAIGVDLNPRAVQLARFNARLNGCENVEFAEGSLYEPLDATDQFDLITANPPFMPTVFADRWASSYWSGGPSGEAVLQPIFEGLGNRLEPGGLAQAVAQVPVRDDDLLVRILEWIDVDVDLLLLLDDTDLDRVMSETHAQVARAIETGALPLRTSMNPARAATRLIDLARGAFQQAGIRAFRYGILNVRGSSGRSKGLRHERSFTDIVLGSSTRIDVEGLFDMH